MNEDPPPGPPSDATRIRPIVAPTQKLTIPGLVIGERIGQGGMAEVYEAEDRGFTPPRLVAVKLIERALSVNPEFRARFEREASIVASFRHDGIVHVYSSGEVSGTQYLVMEYLPGGTLATKLEQGPLPQTEALWTAARLADALAYSHASGIIHRDFKPGNVLFTSKGTPVLSDFGVAKSTSPTDAALTRHVSAIGAPRYMAPEQERGEEVSDRADVFSLALTLYEMLTGELPPAKLRVNPRSADVAPRLPAVEPEVVELICRGLRADPGERPSAREFEVALDDLDPNRTRPRGAVAPHHRPRLPGARRWYSLLIGIGLIAAIGIALVVMRIDRTSPPAVPAQSISPIASAPGPARLAINRSPQDARVYIDGAEAVGDVVRLEPKPHELVALAPGYYGVVQNLDPGADGRTSIEVHLNAVDQPTGAAFDQFLDIEDELSHQADAGGSTAQEPGHTGASSDELARKIDALPEPTLQAALQIRMLQVSGRTAEAETLGKSISELARLGDARAASTVALLLALSRGHFTSEMITPELTQASSAGDPLATFLVALPLLDELSSVPGGFRADSSLKRSYCGQLAKALAQGLGGLPKFSRSDCPR
jgi:hypothetical protein